MQDKQACWSNTRALDHKSAQHGPNISCCNASNCKREMHASEWFNTVVRESNEQLALSSSILAGSAHHPAELPVLNDSLLSIKRLLSLHLR